MINELDREYAISQNYEKGLNAGLAKGREEGLSEGRKEGLAEGEAKGKAKGRQDGVREIAKAMKAEGLALSQIAKITGLQIAEIGAL